MRFGVGGEFSNVLTELGTDLITGAEGALSYPYNLYSATLSPTDSKLYSLWENHYKNPTEIADIIGTFIENNDKYKINMWISLDKDFFININDYNADKIIRYLYERYPW